jgi:NADH:ubiquinone oxidoreductase subunit 6 (subunit J)
MSGILEWIIFLALSLIAVITAAGMLLTMSMYRAGLALMASFVALAGLFILLGADLLAAIQIMMNVGGMLVMVLFMVMIMRDPGGEMMRAMKRDMHIRGLGAFSMTMPRGKPPAAAASQEQQRGDEQGSHDKHMSDHDVSIQRRNAGDHEMNMPEHEMNMSHMRMTPRQYYDMMVGMAMSTTQLPWAIVLGMISALLLIILVILTPWPLASTAPTQDATTAVGELLLSRYMIAFEGAAFLILAGIAGAVIFAQRDRAAVQQQAMQHEPATVEEQVYTCPMHPEVRENQPGNCPRCGMSLIPVKEVAPAGNGHEAHQEHGDHGKHGGHA